MKNLVEQGETLNFTNGSGDTITSGSVVVIGEQIGIAKNDVANGDVGVLCMEGVFTVPKVTAAVIGQGESVIWDSSVGKFDDNLATPATGDVSGACTAWEAAGASATTIAVKINTSKGTVA